MAWVSYGDQKIIPSPHLSIEKVWSRTEDGSSVGSLLRITLNGTFVYGMGGLYDQSGYPPDDFSLSYLADLLAKQQELRDLFAEDYLYFEIQPDVEGVATSTKWIAKVTSIDFPTEPVNVTQWVNKSDYTVVLEAQIGNTDSDYDSLKEFDEIWDLQYNEDPEDTYNLTHTITCSSREQYLVATAEIKAGWQKAYNYVNDELDGVGIDNTIIKNDPGFNLADSFSAYNYVLTQTIDEYSGVYTIRETWMMSTDTTYTTQTVAVERRRDVPLNTADYTVTITGQIAGLKESDGTGYDAAQAEFTDVVEPTLYSTANSSISGVALSVLPVNTSITYDETHRTINYTYIYDNNTFGGTNDQSIAVSTNEVDCNKITITVSGTVQGIKDDTNSAYTNATTLWSTVEGAILSNAEDAYSDYGGGGILQGPSEKSITYNSYIGQISYNYSYHDWETGYVNDQTISIEYDKIKDHNSVTVAGTITAFCVAGYSAAETYFGDTVTEEEAYISANAKYNGNGSLDNKAQSTNISYNAHTRQIIYNYVFNDYDGGADVNITFSVKEGSNDCGYKHVTMEGTITGKRTSTRSAWESADYEFITNYADVTASLVSSYIDNAQVLSATKKYNEFNNTISFSYEFLEETTAYTVYEDVTTNYSNGDCGNIVYVQSGIVKGFCTGNSGSALSNAESGFYTISVPDGANHRMNKSLVKNEREGTVRYTITYSSRSVPYDWEETIAERESITEKGAIKSYSGTITGYCDQDSNTDRKYNNALTGYEANTPTAPDGYIEISKSVSHNRRRGIINYVYEYKQKSSCFAGVNAINESINIVDDLANDIFAVVPVLGGDSVIQDKGGDTPLRRTVTISIQVDPTPNCSFDAGKPNVENVLDNIEPTTTIVLIEKNQESWNPFSGLYSRNKSWIYQNC